MPFYICVVCSEISVIRSLYNNDTPLTSHYIVILYKFVVCVQSDVSNAPA